MTVLTQVERINRKLGDLPRRLRKGAVAVIEEDGFRTTFTHTHDKWVETSVEPIDSKRTTLKVWLDSKRVAAELYNVSTRLYI